MSCYLYILKSAKDNGFYIGISNDPINRLKQHNSGSSKSTKPRQPFTLVYQEEYGDYSEARNREKQLKCHGQIRENLLKEINFYGPIV